MLQNKLINQSRQIHLIIKCTHTLGSLQLLRYTAVYTGNKLKEDYV